jgi:hypothetical protein
MGPGNELTWECSSCGKEKFPDQLSMVDLRCMQCIIQEARETTEECQQNTSSVSTPAK